MILVTGGTGFIGIHLVERLVAQGRQVRCLVRASSQLGGLPLGSIQLANGDLASGQGLAQALAGVDTVIHLAGVTKARTVSDYYAGNATATANLVRAAGDVRHFVHVSSLAAAGPSDGARAINEDAEPHPVSQYGRSKLAGEVAVRGSALRERSIIIRPPVVYGPRDTDVFQVIATAARGWIVRLGRAERPFSMIYVSDLVDGLVAAADHPDLGGRTYFLAHPAPATWDEFGGAAARLMGRTARTLTIPEGIARFMGLCAEWWNKVSRKPGILSRDKITEGCCAGWVCDPTSAQRDMGFSAPTGMEDGLRRAINWYREAGWLKS